MFLIFSALNECDERGNTCSPNSKCKKIPSGSYDCVCIEGYKDVHFGENLKKCEGKKKSCCLNAINCYLAKMSYTSYRHFSILSVHRLRAYT